MFSYEYDVRLSVCNVGGYFNVLLCRQINLNLNKKWKLVGLLGRIGRCPGYLQAEDDPGRNNL